MARKRLVTVLAAAALAAPLTSPAGEVSPQAKRLVDIFLMTCVRFSGDIPALRGWLKEKLAPIAQDHQKSFVGDQWSGIAYSATTDKTGEYAVISYDNGLCMEQARRAVIEDAFRYLEDFYSADGSPITVLEDQRKTVRPGVRVHLRHYPLRKQGIDYLLTGSGVEQPLEDGLQAVLSLSRRSPNG